MISKEYVRGGNQSTSWTCFYFIRSPVDEALQGEAQRKGCSLVWPGGGHRRNDLLVCGKPGLPRMGWAGANIVQPTL